ncbi:hypothetical protein ACIBI9_15555 [Nonomuraea sp. NPDC050451]
MAGLSIPAGFIVGRWIMIVWPVGYLGLRLVAECCIRENRKTARFP